MIRFGHAPPSLASVSLVAVAAASAAHTTRYAAQPIAFIAA